MVTLFLVFFVLAVKEMVTNSLTGTNVIFIIARVVFQKEKERDGIVVLCKRKSHYSSHNCFFTRLNDQTHLAHDIAASAGRRVIFCQQYLNEKRTWYIR